LLLFSIDVGFQIGRWLKSHNKQTKAQGVSW